MNMQHYIRATKKLILELKNLTNAEFKSKLVNLREREKKHLVNLLMPQILQWFFPLTIKGKGKELETAYSIKWCFKWISIIVPVNTI